MVNSIIPVFTGCYTSKRWLSGISEPSTVFSMILATKGYHSLGSNSELQNTTDIYTNFSCSPSEGIIKLPNFPKGLQVF